MPKQTRDPWFKFFGVDFLRDCAGLSAEACAGWARMLCHMHYAERRGILIGDIRYMAGKMGLPEVAARAAMIEIGETGVGDVTEVAGKWKIVCRRMVREADALERDRLRKMNRRQRDARYRAANREACRDRVRAAKIGNVAGNGAETARKRRANDAETSRVNSLTENDLPGNVAPRPPETMSKTMSKTMTTCCETSRSDRLGLQETEPYTDPDPHRTKAIEILSSIGLIVNTSPVDISKIAQSVEVAGADLVEESLRRAVKKGIGGKAAVSWALARVGGEMYKRTESPAKTELQKKREENAALFERVAAQERAERAAQQMSERDAEEIAQLQSRF